MKDILIYVLVYGGMLLVIYGIGYFASNRMSDNEIISPAEGIECVVVSRMFNTSVDCWEKKSD